MHVSSKSEQKSIINKLNFIQISILLNFKNVWQKISVTAKNVDM